ncbi:MAG TPA: type II secretion system F family protein [Vicinamibacterales bacterium]|nr:type II secretion system F family protein [Vicinamibacterales bacterium]
MAESEAGLRRELEDKGLFLLSVRGGGAAVRVGRVNVGLPARRRVPTAAFLIFNQELATLLRAGLPLVQSLNILRKRTPNPTFKAALDDVHERVRSGSSLSDAFEAQGLFPGIYMASLTAGEKSGSLEQVVRRYVQHVKVLSRARRQIISALVYPAILVALSVAVVGLVIFKLVPELALFYQQYGPSAQLPLSTRIVVALSTRVIESAGLLVLVLAGATAAVLITLRQPDQRRRLHAAILRLPYFGPLARKFATAQVSRTLATLLSGGIPLVNAIEISAKSTGNLAVGDSLHVVAREVREGSGLADAIGRAGMFPHVAVEMVEVGESTGALAEMLTSVADFYDEENETSLTRFTSMIEPILLIVMGVVIAGLLLSLYMPLFKLSSLTAG